MDIPEYVETRRKRYLKLSLEKFERDIEPFLDDSPEAREAADSFKAMIRSQFANFAADVSQDDSGIQINGAAVDIHDRLSTVR